MLTVKPTPRMLDASATHHFFLGFDRDWGHRSVPGLPVCMRVTPGDAACTSDSATAIGALAAMSDPRARSRPAAPTLFVDALRRASA